MTVHHASDISPTGYYCPILATGGTCSRVTIAASCALDTPANGHAGRWVDRYRTHGGVIFVNLRDRSGIVQATFRQDSAPDAFAVAEQVRNEWYFGCRARYSAARQAGEPGDATGRWSGSLRRGRPNPSDTPFTSTARAESGGAAAKVPLPGPAPAAMQRNLILRHHAVKFIRDFLSERGFIESRRRS